MQRSIPVIFVRIVVSALLVISFSFSNSTAREPEKKPVFLQKEWSKDDYAGALYELTGNVMAPAAVDTFHIVRYDFEMRDWQGWTSFDGTAQYDTFWHVDDFAGLGGGDYGRLTPLEGSKSMWCGARPGVGPYMCGWDEAPPLQIDYSVMFPTVLNHSGYISGEAGHFEDTPGVPFITGKWCLLQTNFDSHS